MAVQQLAHLTLSDDERAELKSLTTRREDWGRRWLCEPGSY